MMKKSNFPPAWDEARVQRVLKHYESQSDAEAVGEDEASFEETTHTAMEVPVELVPAVRELIAKRKRSASLGDAADRLRRPLIASSLRSWLMEMPGEVRDRRQDRASRDDRVWPRRRDPCALAEIKAYVDEP